MVEKHKRDTNSPRDHPCQSDFYRIEHRNDGAVDVILKPEMDITDKSGKIIVEKTVIIVEGVIPWTGLEEDIRRRYDAWCKSGRRIEY